MKNEVKVNVLNQPYGGFPWIDLPMAANTNWYNAHNFYGDLDAPRRGDARGRAATSSRRSTRRTTPCSSSSATSSRRRRKGWIEKYFATIPAAKLPPPPDLAEPRQEKEKRAGRTDPLANRPALGLAYHVPARNTPEWYAMGLHRPDARAGPGLAALRRARAQAGADRRASMPASTGASATCSTTAARCSGSRRSSTTRARRRTRSLEAVDAVIDAAPAAGASIRRRSIARCVKMRSSLYAGIEQFAGFGRANLLASFALFDDDPARINRLEAEFAKVTPALMQKTAREYLRPTNRTVYVDHAGQGRTPRPAQRSRDEATRHATTTHRPRAGSSGAAAAVRPAAPPPTARCRAARRRGRDRPRTSCCRRPRRFTLPNGLAGHDGAVRHGAEGPRAARRGRRQRRTRAQHRSGSPIPSARCCRKARPR